MTVNDVIFGTINSKEYGLYPVRVEIETPKVKRKTIDIAGMDGELDLSEALDGVLRYYNRTITIRFQCFAQDKDYILLEQKCKNDLHGKRMKISFDTDSDYYYIGVVEVEWASEEVVDTATININCEPYKYKNYKTIVERDIKVNNIITLVNEKMPTNPVVTVSNQMTLSFMVQDREVSKTLTGTTKLTELCMLAGEYQVKVNGTGHIKFEWQEGAL